MTAERVGIPAVGVMTTQFVSAAALMSRVLGMPDHGFAVVEHPISSAGDEGLRVRAVEALAQIRRLLSPS